MRTLIRNLLAARAEGMWASTTREQRRGYHAAGVGFAAGRFIDEHLSELFDFLGQAEGGVLMTDVDVTVNAVIGFAELAFKTAPFQPPKGLPSKWTEGLAAWIRGRTSSEVLDICEKDGVDFLQDAVTYRLPWAMEAVRVHAEAVSHPGADDLIGLAPLAVESGSSKLSVITLVRNGLSSREAAHAAVSTTSANFDDVNGMRVWLRSDEVKERHPDKSWPTEQSRHVWEEFYEARTANEDREWKRSSEIIAVDWDGGLATARDFGSYRGGGWGVVDIDTVVRKVGFFHEQVRVYLKPDREV